jgi:hypothetical protein
MFISTRPYSLLFALEVPGALTQASREPAAAAEAARPQALPTIPPARAGNRP